MTLIKNCLGHIPLFILAIAFVTICSFFFSPSLLLVTPQESGVQEGLVCLIPCCGSQGPGLGPDKVGTRQTLVGERNNVCRPLYSEGVCVFRGTGAAMKP